MGEHIEKGLCASRCVHVYKTLSDFSVIATRNCIDYLNSLSACELTQRFMPEGRGYPNTEALRLMQVF